MPEKTHFHPLELHVHIEARVTGGEWIDYEVTVPIPEGYDAADVRALTVRQVEDAAFALNLREFGRSATRGALIAAAARLRGLRETLDDTNPSPIPLRLRLLALFALSNAEVAEQWGEDVEGS